MTFFVCFSVLLGFLGALIVHYNLLIKKSRRGTGKRDCSQIRKYFQGNSFNALNLKYYIGNKKYKLGLNFVTGLTETEGKLTIYKHPDIRALVFKSEYKNRILKI